ncbi:MAG: choice-of-anchor D domain-containing protein, partial [Terrimicrobiaceae bacterium]
GYQWVIVPSHHISRTCPTYNTKANPEGSYNIFSSPPNKADQLGPSPTDGWWYSEPNPGNAAWNVAPYAYQLHKVKYVNPDTGAEKTMIAVPSDDVLSYRYGYANEGVGKIDTFIAPFATDPARPVMVMPSTDGDNAWGGGSSSWFEATPQLFNDSAARGYKPSTPQDFVNAFGSNAPMAHIEDGAWIFPEMCYGSPNFMKWIEPPVATIANRGVTTVPGTQIDMETPGFALKFYSYAPLMAGANWLETAEQILKDEGGSVQPWKIATPYDWDGSWTGANDVELAWHIYLKGLDSGFNYYGGLGNDDEMKPGLATRRAVEKLTPWMTDARRNNDRTPPTVLKPQRFPYNPGWFTFGWFNQQPQIPNNAFLKRMNSEFYIWTHAYDLSGIPDGNVKLKIRIDNDGTNPLASNQNETYAGGSEVGQWVTVNMTKRTLPKTREALNIAAANSQIDYFLPVQDTAVADYYFAKITNDNLPNFRSKLLDYYIEATDSKNNTSKSEIQHVWVDDFSGQTNGGGGGGGGGGGNASTTVSLNPATPIAGQSLTVTYNPAGRNLASATVVNIHHGYNQNIAANWTPLPGVAMTKVGGNWTYTYTVPANATTIALVFNNGSGTWDNNGGGNWNFTVNASVPTQPPAAPVGLAATATSNSSISLTWNATANATSYIVFRNGTQAGTPQDPNFIDTGLADETTYSYTVRAVNAAGNSTAPTAVSATTLFAPLQPAQVKILEPAGGSTANGSTQLFSGRAGSGFTGGLVWTNLSNNATGTITFPGGSVPNGWNWSASIPLAVGNNTIVFRGNQTVLRSDEAANYTSWSTNSTGGQGFGAWTLNATGSAGFFLANTATNTNMSLGANTGFGFWANGGGVSTASRPISTPMAAGDSLSVKFDNNSVAAGGEVGFSLADSSGTERFRFFFAGGQANYRVSDASGVRETAQGWSDSGLTPVFALTGNNSYSFTIGTNTLTGNLATGGQIARVAFQNKNAGLGAQYDFYIGTMSLAQSGNTSESITITRQNVDATDGLPNSWWAQYGITGSDRVASADTDSDGLTNAEEFALGSDPVNAADPAPNIVVEDSTGGAVTSNSTILSLGNVAVGGTPGTAAISIRNTGPGYLRNLALSRDGTHSPEFTTGPLVYSTLAPGSNATVTVSFSPASGGNRTARLLIASNDPAKNPFTVLLGGFGIGTNLDTDGDGLNDAAEFGMSGLGFDWRTSQPNLVGSLAQNADKAGYFDEQSVRDMNVGMPLISKNATTGKFKLTIELEKSTNLGQGFQPMPFEETGTYLTQDGKLQFEFNSPDNAGFFRLKAK